MGNTPKKVLVVGMTDNPGGIETFMLNVISSVDASAVRFDFLANTEKIAFEQRLVDYGARIYRITPRRKSRSAFYRDLRQVFSECAGDYDAVWENMNTLGNIDYLVYAKRFGIPTRIIHAHGSANTEGIVRGALHWVNKKRIRGVATHFWSASEEASRWFYGEDFASLPNHRVIDNAIDLDRFKYSLDARVKIREQFCVSDDELLLGNVGRLHPVKNQALILDVVAELKSRGVAVRALFVGQGELWNELTEKAKLLGIEDLVIFRGAVEDVSSIYSAIDLFMFPSINEGFGFAMLEAQASGVPCLASNAIPEDAIWNDNVSVVSLDSDVSVWADNVLLLTKAGRTDNIALTGSRYDLSHWGETMSNLLEFECA